MLSRERDTLLEDEFARLQYVPAKSGTVDMGFGIRAISGFVDFILEDKASRAEAACQRLQGSEQDPDKKLMLRHQ